jgi:hypothetical protein
MQTDYLTAKRFSFVQISAGSPVVAVFALCSVLIVLPTVAFGQDAVRPPSWTDATHSNDADPDYDRLFAMDRVHQIHITITPGDFAAMREDLQTVIGGGFLGVGRGGQGGPPRGDDFGALTERFAVIADGFEAAANVCADQAPEAACTINDTEGQCVAAFGDQLICVPQALAGIVNGGPGRRGGLAPEMTSRDPIYVPVTISYDGRTWSGVGMRYKGNSSLMTARMSGNGKVPFRLDFDKYEDEMPEIRNQRFYGFDKLTFSSNFSDDSMLKEVLATEVFRDRGVPAARAAFYRVFVDTGNGDEYWGLYTMIEDPADGAMLDAQFGDDDGNLYKPSGPGANWDFFDPQGFEKKNNEDAADFSDVSAAIEALHASQDDPAAWREALEEELDVDLFLRWLAVNSVIENWDAYGRLAHNYYLYGDPKDDGRLKWIPWDHNMSFGMAGGGMPGGFGRGGGFAPPPGIENPGRGGPGGFFGGGGDDVLHADAGDTWPLISLLLADEVYSAQYRAELERALEGLAAPDALEARARELHALITPFAIGLQGEQPTHTTLSSPSGFMQALDGPNGLIAQFNERHDQIRTALAAR